MLANKNNCNQLIQIVFSDRKTFGAKHNLVEL